jgi:hypothetical protein
MTNISPISPIQIRTHQRINLKINNLVFRSKRYLKIEEKNNYKLKRKLVKIKYFY